MRYESSSGASKERARATHYDVLSIPPPKPGGPSPTQQDIRAGYRRALLTNHPDKAGTLLKSDFAGYHFRPHHGDKKSKNGVGSKWTVDEMCVAYRILSDQGLRRAYDAQLLEAYRYNEPLNESRGTCDAQKKDSSATTELDVIDLDDMEYNEGTKNWTRSCRCGKADSFAITEDDLLEDETYQCAGEILVGCSDCSHHIKVVFAVADDDE